MVLTTKQLKDYSWMSQASYLNMLSSADAQVALTTSVLSSGKNFSAAQAQSFLGTNTQSLTDGFNFISHQSNDSSGFSATVFKSNASGAYTIAVRGTEQISIADVLNGK